MDAANTRGQIWLETLRFTAMILRVLQGTRNRHMVTRHLRLLVDYQRLYDQLVLDTLIPPSRRSDPQPSAAQLLAL